MTIILTALASDKRVGAIEVIANTAEKYTQIKTQRFVVHDSMSHLIGSLDNLCKSLRQRGLWQENQDNDQKERR